MNRTSDGNEQETTEKSTPPKVCPLCESPLIGEAIKTGKCQCCGHVFDTTKSA